MGDCIFLTKRKKENNENRKSKVKLRLLEYLGELQSIGKSRGKLKLSARVVDENKTL